MRYADRIHLIKVVQTETPLGLEEKELKFLVPCAVQNQSLEEIEFFIGDVTSRALKAHVQGNLENFVYADYQGFRYRITGNRKHRNETVFFLEGENYA